VFQALIGILQTGRALFFLLSLVPVSSPYRYSSNRSGAGCGRSPGAVSSPYRYSSNSRRVSGRVSPSQVSSPYRYSSNGGGGACGYCG